MRFAVVAATLFVWLTLIPSNALEVRVPVNPHASPAAKELFFKLTRLSGKGMLAGQHDYIETPNAYLEKLFSITGQHPAVHGYEVGAILGQTQPQIDNLRQKVIDNALSWHRRGGIVALTYHASFPGTCACWDNVQRRTTNEEFSQLLQHGTALNKELLADLDRLAIHLMRLRDADVPVLWRPYHEMNGAWFWWGQKAQYRELWDLVYTHFTNKHRLHNLIWVWSANAPVDDTRSYEEFYPGADKVDILGLDIYDVAFLDNYHDELVRFAQGKVIAITENGGLPNPSSAVSADKRWLWQMTWGKLLSNKNKPEEIYDFMHHPSTITLEKWRKF